ncbi:MAG: prepilin peptidase [Erysipelotrichaceae bacterium]|nr:prepilin peptidase [Erysipelotrichaceae bacterium]
MAMRIPANRNWITGHSQCEHCGHRLSYREMVPVISYVIQKGRCRCCNHRISLRYPLTELIMGVLTVLLYVKYEGAAFFLREIYICILFLMALIDRDTMEVPVIALTLETIVSMMVFCTERHELSVMVYGLLETALPASICSMMGYMGGADVLIIMSGSLLFESSERIVISYLFSLIAGCLFGMMLRCRNKKTDRIPFIPCLWLVYSLLIIY